MYITNQNRYSPSQSQELSFGWTRGKLKSLLDEVNQNLMMPQQKGNLIFIPSIYKFWYGAQGFTVSRNPKLALKISNQDHFLNLRAEQIRLAKQIVYKNAEFNGKEVVIVDLDGVLFNENNIYKDFSNFFKNPLVYLQIKLGLVDKRAPRSCVSHFLHRHYDPYIRQNQLDVYHDMGHMIKELQQKNVQVIGITSRNEELAEVTRKNLSERGGVVLDHIVFKPAEAAKSGRDIGHKRQALVDISHHKKILAVFGDNTSDLLPHKNLEGFNRENIHGTVNVLFGNVFNSTGIKEPLIG